MMSCYYKMNHTHLFLKDFITELTFFHTQSIEGFRGGKKFELWNYGVIIFFFFLILSPQIRHIKYINFKNYTLYHYYKQESLIITELSKTQLFIFIEHDCHYRFIFLSNHIHFFFFDNRKMSDHIHFCHGLALPFANWLDRMVVLFKWSCISVNVLVCDYHKISSIFYIFNFHTITKIRYLFLVMYIIINFIILCVANQNKIIQTFIK